MAGWHLGADDGDGIWFLGSFMRFKATAESTGGAFALIDETAGPGRASPPHIHHAEDEAFWVIDGEVTFTCGGETTIAGPGSFVFLPRDVQHNFRVTSEVPARMLLWISPAGLEGFFRTIGEEGSPDKMPAPTPPDVERLLALGAEYRVEHPTLEAKLGK
jgi:mannose-6-phosphate isomerase-like protein (cupin superfamily)